jgi:DNA recombination protein RmuC
MVFSKLPADWQVRDFGVEGKVCEFGLRLPNKRIMPIDSKWAATSLLEKFMACEEISGKKKIKLDIEKAVLRKAEEVKKYLDPETTCGFGVAVVPDAIYDLCGATLCQVFEMRVAVISYSMFVPYLLLVFQTNLKASVDVDMHKLSHAISESEKSVKAIQDKLDGSFSKGITQLSNSRDEVKREVANVSKLLNGIHVDKVNHQIDEPLAALVTDNL